MSRLDLVTSSHIIGEYGFDYATSQGVSIPSASAAWGSWTELSAGAANDANAIMVFVGPRIQNVNYNGFLQIGVGALGAEIPVSAPIPVSMSAESKESILLGVNIKKGDRIVARFASPDATSTFAAIGGLWLSGQPLPKIVHTSFDETGGPSVAAPIGLPYPTADNTLTAWTEICAACPAGANALLFQLSTKTRTGGEADEYMIFEIGVGVSGSERVLARVLTALGAWNNLFDPSVWRLPLRVNKGDRLSVRWQSSSATLHTAWTCLVQYALERYQ